MKIVFVIIGIFFLYQVHSQDKRFFEYQNFEDETEKLIKETQLNTENFPMVFLDSFSIENLRYFSVYQLDKKIASLFLKQRIFTLEDDPFLETVEVYIIGKKYYQFNPSHKINSYFVLILIKDFESIEYYYKGIYSLNFKHERLKSIALLADKISDYQLGNSQITSFIQYEGFDTIAFKVQKIIDHTHGIEKEILLNSFFLKEDGFINFLKE